MIVSLLVSLQLKKVGFVANRSVANVSRDGINGILERPRKTDWL